MQYRSPCLIDNNSGSQTHLVLILASRLASPLKVQSPTETQTSFQQTEQKSKRRRHSEPDDPRPSKRPTPDIQLSSTYIYANLSDLRHVISFPLPISTERCQVTVRLDKLDDLNIVSDQSTAHKVLDPEFNTLIFDRSGIINEIESLIATSDPPSPPRIRFSAPSYMELPHLLNVVEAFYDLLTTEEQYTITFGNLHVHNDILTRAHRRSCFILRLDLYKSQDMDIEFRKSLNTFQELYKDRIDLNSVAPAQLPPLDDFVRLLTAVEARRGYQRSEKVLINICCPLRGHWLARPGSEHEKEAREYWFDRFFEVCSRFDGVIKVILVSSAGASVDCIAPSHGLIEGCEVPKIAQFFAVAQDQVNLALRYTLGSILGLSALTADFTSLEISHQLVLKQLAGGYNSHLSFENPKSFLCVKHVLYYLHSVQLSASPHVTMAEKDRVSYLMEDFGAEDLSFWVKAIRKAPASERASLFAAVETTYRSATLPKLPDLTSHGMMTSSLTPDDFSILDPKKKNSTDLSPATLIKVLALDGLLFVQPPGQEGPSATIQIPNRGLQRCIEVHVIQLVGELLPAKVAKLEALYDAEKPVEWLKNALIEWVSAMTWRQSSDIYENNIRDYLWVLTNLTEREKREYDDASNRSALRCCAVLELRVMEDSQDGPYGRVGYVDIMSVPRPLAPDHNVAILVEAKNARRRCLYIATYGLLSTSGTASQNTWITDAELREFMKLVEGLNWDGFLRWLPTDEEEIKDLLAQEETRADFSLWNPRSTSSRDRRVPDAITPRISPHIHAKVLEDLDIDLNDTRDALTPWHLYTVIWDREKSALCRRSVLYLALKARHQLLRYQACLQPQGKHQPYSNCYVDDDRLKIKDAPHGAGQKLLLLGVYMIGGVPIMDELMERQTRYDFSL
ncbi:hypothetical protein AAF712_016428 [Marasmius tenuissimus]|uniref:Uncharacterized protein n=1 Tax=Marasmius tenuissimus TaxID=585030 RepID=A0ABR2Z7N8_9AGAR